MFGGYNTDFISGNITYEPTIGTFYWQLNLKTANYNGVNLIGGLRTSIIDSGTSYIILN